MTPVPFVPPEVKTGLVVPVMSEWIVRLFAPLWMNNSDPDEVMRPRVLALVAAPMVRAALSEPESRPPLARVSVSGVALTKFTVLAAPLRVRELMVCPPLRTLWVPLIRTLLEAVAAARVTVCSRRLIGRMPATAS